MRAVSAPAGLIRPPGWTRFLSLFCFTPRGAPVPGGFQGRLLRVDLTRGKWREEALDWKEARRFLGSKGYAAQLLFKELAPGTDPLSTENKVVMMTGP